MQPKTELITIDNNTELIEKLIHELILKPRLDALAWSKITKQTPNMKVGYPGQHLASLVVGMEGMRTGARGHDIVDGSEVKSCSRVDQLDSCNNCGEKVLRVETACSNCGSESLKRMNDSKWLFTIRTEQDLKTLTEEVERVILAIADYPNFDEGDFDTIRFQVFEIWTNSPRCSRFKEIMTNYFEKIYAEHKAKDANKTPAPKNFWPYSYQFYMCNPICVFSAIVENANSEPTLTIETYVEPNEDRNDLESELMPSNILNKDEWQILNDNISELADLLGEYIEIDDIDEFLEQLEKGNLKKLSPLLPYISEEVRAYLPLRDTDKIATAKQAYSRR